jgi:hypothetical protein
VRGGPPVQAAGTRLICVPNCAGWTLAVVQHCFIYRPQMHPAEAGGHCGHQTLRPFVLLDDKGQPLSLTTEDIAAFAGVILAPVQLEAFIRWVCE